MLRQRIKSIAALILFYNYTDEHETCRELCNALFDDITIAMSFHLNLEVYKMADAIKQDKDRRCMLKTVGRL